MDESIPEETSPPAGGYSEANIRVLNGVEAIRMRPGMYLGSADARGLHVMLMEVVDLAVGEVSAGAGRAVEVRLHRDGAATVHDDGPGFAMEGPISLEGAMSRLYYGAGWSSNGLPVLNALSASVEAEVRRGGFLWRQTFGRGETTSSPERLGPTRTTGTAFLFRPDPEIFSDATFDAGPIAERLADLAAINPEVRFEFHDDRSGRSETWELRGGLVDLVRDLNRGRSLVHDPIAFQGGCGKAWVNVAFQYHEGAATDLRVFANAFRLDETADLIHSRSGLNYHERSPHVVGFLKALQEALGPLGKPIGTSLLDGLTAAIAIRLEVPSFRGATRDTLDSPEAEPIAFSVAFLRLFAHFEEHPEVARRIRERIRHPATLPGS